MADVADRLAYMREKWGEASASEEEPAPVEETAPEVEAAPEPAPAPEEAPEAAAPAEEPPKEGGERVRDESGRFAAAPKAEQQPKAKPAPATSPTAQEPAKPPEPKHPGADLKAPQSWTATAREAWKDVPPAARQEIHRLEGETRKVLQANAQLRQEGEQIAERYKQETGFRQQIEGLINPLAGVFAAQDMKPMDGAASVLQSYAALTLGTRAQRATLLAQLIGAYSSTDDVLAILGGQVAPVGYQPARAPASQPQQPVDIKAAIREQMQEFASQASNARADREFSDFEATSPEFLRDVWDDMVSILDHSQARGVDMTYQQAYDRACKLNDHVSTVIAQRAAAAAVTAQPSAAAQRARVAAGTIRSKPASPAGEQVDLGDRMAVIRRMANRQ